MNIGKMMQSLGSGYGKTSLWCKVLLFMSLLLLLVIVFKGIHKKQEGFEQQDAFVVKTGPDIYDDFYANIYDYLVFNSMKDDYEVGFIMKNISPTLHGKMLDIGCGTGHHVGLLGAKGMDVLGIDVSPSMISKAKENYPDSEFAVKDALQGDSFEPDTFAHIACMYFTVYYFRDKSRFFHNCFRWLIPGGNLIVHLVDRENFDPILPPGNPLIYVSPQRYAEKRITSTKVKFTDFSYSADFRLDGAKDKATFVEKFKNDDDGKVRKHEHEMYMPDVQEIVDEAQACGFIVSSKSDLLECQYEYQYLYVFTKPN